MVKFIVPISDGMELKIEVLNLKSLKNGAKTKKRIVLFFEIMELLFTDQFQISVFLFLLLQHQIFSETYLAWRSLFS